MADEIGEGAVLYDTRPPERRPCCSTGGGRAGRCLAHVTTVWADANGDQRLYEVWDGTHTTREYVLGEDLLALYEPAGWRWPIGRKPTYHLTRTCGVFDAHDVMVEEHRR